MMKAQPVPLTPTNQGSWSGRLKLLASLALVSDTLQQILAQLNNLVGDKSEGEQSEVPLAGEQLATDHSNAPVIPLKKAS